MLHADYWQFKIKRPRIKWIKGKKYTRHKKEIIVVVLSFYEIFLKGNLEFIRNLDWEHLET